MANEINKALHGYYNYTPSRAFSGEKKPHWTDDFEKKPSTYYNVPKLGEGSLEAGTRFWNEPKKEESTMINSLKDAFGFGTEKAAPEPEVDSIVKSAYKVDKHEHLENLLESDIDEKDYVDAAIKFERKSLRDYLTREYTTNDEQKKIAEERLNKSYEELYSVFSEAFQNAKKSREENTSAFSRFADKESIMLPYTRHGDIKLR